MFHVRKDTLAVVIGGTKEDVILNRKNNE